MARSSNMVIPEVTQVEGVRVLQEKLDVLRGATNGAIDLSYDPTYLAENGGDFIEPVVFARPSGGIQHSDEANPTDTATPAAISQAKGKSVIQTNFAYYGWTRDEERRGKMTPAQYSLALAEFLADDKLVKIRNNLVAAGTAAIDSMDTPSANYHIIDAARGKAAGARVPFSYAYMNKLMGKMGDAMGDIVAFLMPSACMTSLFADGLSNYKVENVAGAMVINGVPFAMGRAIVVADIPALSSTLTSGYYAEHAVLGLGKGALTARVVGEDPVSSEAATNKKVLNYTIRQDFDVDYSVSGMKWGVATINPTDGELATSSNWDEFLSDHRECKIVKGIFNASA